MDDKNLIERTRRTAKRLFDGPVQVELPHQLWKRQRGLPITSVGGQYHHSILPKKSTLPPFRKGGLGGFQSLG
jgi:hypothetical protein